MVYKKGMDTLRYSNLYDLFSSYSLDNIKSQYIDLLSFLTKVEDLSDTVFLQKVGTISKMGEILICYFVDVNGECVIIGTGTIFFEPKMIRGGKSVGHIEDIVVHPNYRSFGIATTIIRKLIDLGLSLIHI